MVQQGDGTTHAAPPRAQQGDDAAGATPETGEPAHAPGRRVRRRRADLARELRVAGRAGAVLGLLAAAGSAWWTWPSWATPALALVAAAGALVAVVDARTHRLPDVIVLPTWVGTVLLLGVGTLGTGDADALGRALAGGLLGFGAYAALRIAYPPGLGFGDVKLAGMLGTPLAWLGWGELVAGVVVPFLLGGAWALGLVVARRARRGMAVPFGPFMVAGAYLAAALGDAALRAYGVA